MDKGGFSPASQEETKTGADDEANAEILPGEKERVSTNMVTVLIDFFSLAVYGSVDCLSSLLVTASK